ncbi:MAG: hypothetical protein AAGA09_07915 [Pseudomonadota bacterium]
MRIFHRLAFHVETSSKFARCTVAAMAAVVALTAPACSRSDGAAAENAGVETASAAAQVATVAQNNGALAIVGSAGNQEDADDGSRKLQIGPWAAATFSFEEPYINLLRASDGQWVAENYSTNDLYEAGVLDPVTGLPVKPAPNGSPVKSKWMQNGAINDPETGQLRGFGEYYAGEWVLEWEGDAEIKLEGGSAKIDKVERNRIEFHRGPPGSAVNNAVRISMTWIGRGGVTKMALYRKENEALHRAGKIYNPRFIDMVRQYHVVRMMDLQEANRALISSVDQIATMDAAHWGNYQWLPTKETRHSHFSMPLEAVFALAVEADVELWAHAPMQLGASFSVFDYPTRSAHDHFGEASFANAAEILSSPEWERYADAFVAALIASGYPETRTLYVTLDNEVWNISAKYAASVHYARGVGEYLTGDKWSQNHGYGYLMGKWHETLEAALKRAGRSQPVVYMVESQTAWDVPTKRALVGYKKYFEDKGLDWKAAASRTALGLNNYWGDNSWVADVFPDISAKKHGSPTADENTAMHQRFYEALSSMGTDALAKKVADAMLNGPETTHGSRASIVRNWRTQRAMANSFGITQFHAYEGGSHSREPKFMASAHGPHSAALKAFYRDFMRSPEAARVNCGVLDALWTEFPSSVLSNYVGAGDLGSAPWFDGQYGENTPMQQCWAKYGRAATVAE